MEAVLGHFPVVRWPQYLVLSQVEFFPRTEKPTGKWRFSQDLTVFGGSGTKFLFGQNKTAAIREQEDALEPPQRVEQVITRCPIPPISLLRRKTRYSKSSKEALS